jgi:endonuclease/exonuclease/phosphatase family metal-dependent hydrolase
VPEKRPAVIVCGDFNSPPSSSSLTLFHNNNYIQRISFHTKTFDEWYARVWEDFQADPLAVKGALASAYR